MTAVRLTDLLGEETPDGRVVDLGVRLDRRHPRVVARVVERHGRRTTVPAGADVLLLARDVLDTQVVDVRGRRLARVGDVVLERTASGLEVTGVETGPAAVARRLGAGRLARRLHVGRVAWEDLHLTSGRGHRLQLRGEAAVHRADPEALAHLLVRLPVHRGKEVLDGAAPADAHAALRSLTPAAREPYLGGHTDPRPGHVQHHRRFRRVMHARRHAPS